MNKEHTLWQLKEAQEQLSETIENLSTDQEYEFGDFVVEMSHLYHHINTAWNSQDASTSETSECSEENFSKWRQMPSASELLLDS